MSTTTDNVIRLDGRSLTRGRLVAVACGAAVKLAAQ